MLRQILRKATKEPPPPLEEGTEAMPAFLAPLPYSKVEMRLVASRLGGQQEVLVAEKALQLGRAPESGDGDGDLPLLALLDRGGRWVALCVIAAPVGFVSNLLAWLPGRQTRQTLLLYKDPLGEPVPPDVIQILEERFGHLEPVDHRGQEQVDGTTVSSGPLSLRNMKILIEGMQKNEEKFIEELPNIQFYTEEGLMEEKLHLIPKYATELSGNTKFKQKLCEWVESLPLDLMSEIHELQADARENMCPGTGATNHEQIMRKVTKLKERLDPLTRRDHEDFKITLKMDFPEEANKFTYLFQIIQSIKEKDNRDGVLRNVSSKLGLNMERLQTFSALSEQKTGGEENGREAIDGAQKVEALAVRPLEAVEAELPLLNGGPAAEQRDNTALPQLLANIKYSTDRGPADAGERVQRMGGRVLDRFRGDKTPTGQVSQLLANNEYSIDRGPADAGEMVQANGGRVLDRVGFGDQRRTGQADKGWGWRRIWGGTGKGTGTNEVKASDGAQKVEPLAVRPLEAVEAELPPLNGDPAAELPQQLANNEYSTVPGRADGGERVQGMGGRALDWEKDMVGFGDKRRTGQADKGWGWRRIWGGTNEVGGSDRDGLAGVGEVEVYGNRKAEGGCGESGNEGVREEGVGEGAAAEGDAGFGAVEAVGTDEGTYVLKETGDGFGAMETGRVQGRSEGGVASWLPWRRRGAQEGGGGWWPWSRGDAGEASSPDLRWLEAQFRQVRQLGKQWRAATPRRLRGWADRCRSRELLTDQPAVCEVVAALERANELATGGHRLRDPQVLTLLLLLQPGRGLLCQVRTGEGKTAIVAMLAAARALQGHTVDVITSSPVLAAEAARQRAPFFNLLGLTVATNNRKHGAGAAPDRPLTAYTADVLYGAISSFQFDYLRDSFESYGTRCGRPFGHVILDEVDSMLVDNGGHIAKVAAPFAGMEALRWVYIKIWRELQLAAHSCGQKIESQLRETQEQQGSLSTQEASDQLSRARDELWEAAKPVILKRIRESSPTDVEILPQRLRKYADAKLDRWLKNALHAMFDCHEDEQYRILPDEDGEKVVAPVDYLNTGVTQHNTVWADGLQQFVQLKHGLRLSPDTLTSCFISNIGYIRQYPAENIRGLTGTLGSRAEQELLAGIYGVDFAEVPTYRHSRFQELAGSAVPDSAWACAAATEAMNTAQLGRALLLICETQRDAVAVKHSLQALQDQTGEVVSLRSYASEEDDKALRDPVRPGDAILATNLAGRGTDFRTDPALEAAGGLHVCVGFLPCNTRVQEQAFGRTARQGNAGSARLLVRHSELRRLGLDPSDPDVLAAAVAKRDAAESRRIKEIQSSLVPELAFKDALFERFSQLHLRLKNEWISRESYSYVLQDLKQCWAFWLEGMDFTRQIPSEEMFELYYEGFEKHAAAIIAGEISQNSYHSIGQAEYFLRTSRPEDAEKVLINALKMCDNDAELLYGAHMKLFEVAIVGGNQWLAALADLFRPVLPISYKTAEDYKTKSQDYLNMAKTAMEREVSFMNTKIFPAVCSFASKDSSLLRHLKFRAVGLRLNVEMAEQLIATIQNSDSTTGVALVGRCPDLWSRLGVNDFPATVKAELTAVGLGPAYEVRELSLRQFNWSTVVAGLTLVGSGLAVAAVGMFFPWLMGPLGALAEFLIVEGVFEVVMSLVKFALNLPPYFSCQEFATEKFKALAACMITWGVSALFRAYGIVIRVTTRLQRVVSLLNQSTIMKKLHRDVPGIIELVSKILAETNSVQLFLTTAFDFHKFTTWGDIVIKLIKNSNENCVDLTDLKATLKKQIKAGIAENKQISGKLRTGKKERNIYVTISLVRDKFLFKWYTQIFVEALNNVGIGSFAQNMLRKRIPEVLQMMEKELQGGSNNNDLDELEERISEEVSSLMCETITPRFAIGLEKKRKVLLAEESTSGGKPPGTEGSRKEVESAAAGNAQKEQQQTEHIPDPVTSPPGTEGNQQPHSKSAPESAAVSKVHRQQKADVCPSPEATLPGTDSGPSTSQSRSDRTVAGNGRQRKRRQRLQKRRQ